MAKINDLKFKIDTSAFYDFARIDCTATTCDHHGLQTGHGNAGFRCMRKVIQIGPNGVCEYYAGDPQLK